MNFPNRKPIDEVVDELIKLNDWFSKSYKTATIDQLKNCRDKIVTYLTTLSTFIGEAKDDQLTTERVRKFTHHSKKKTLMTENDMSSIKAETEAIIDGNELQKEADSAEGYYTTLKLLLDQMNKVAEALSQDIAIVRKEMENAR